MAAHLTGQWPVASSSYTPVILGKSQSEALGALKILYLPRRHVEKTFVECV